MAYIGPIALGLLLGFILGTRIKPVPESKLKFDKEVYIIIIIAAIIIAVRLGPFPYYTDDILASGFISTIAGLVIGKLTLGR